MRPHGSQKLLEVRRHKALSLLDTGLSLNEVGRRIGCNASSVMRWRDVRDEYGDEGLMPKAVPGRPRRLSPTQLCQLVDLLSRGAMENGYRTELWTTARIAEIIWSKFGVRYHRDHVGRLMSRLNWTYQKPERRALERNEEAIEDWKRKEWPRIKKTLRGWVPISSL